MDSLLKEGDIELFSNPLELRKNPNNDYYESSLNIINKTRHYLIFKIYINQKLSLYNVHPSTSFLKPNSQINVQVRKYNKEEEEENIEMSDNENEINASSKKKQKEAINKKVKINVEHSSIKEKEKAALELLKMKNKLFGQ